jgi:hypothetical protein
VMIVSALASMACSLNDISRHHDRASIDVSAVRVTGVFVAGKP